MTDPLNTALEQAAQPREAVTIFHLLDRNRPQLAKRLPSGIEWDWFEGCVRAELRRTPKLLECDPTSVAAAMVQAIAVGLTPGPLGHVYFVPFKHECQFVLGYKGMVELAFRSERVKDLQTGLVYDGDAFAFRKGTRKYLDHTPSGPAGDRDYTHVYAIASLKGGGTEFEVLFPDDIDRAIARSPSGAKGQGPWVTDRVPMMRKTALRRLSPVLPQSPLFAQALASDETTPTLLDGSPTSEDEADNAA
jgi:recombination protein RecT